MSRLGTAEPDPIKSLTGRWVVKNPDDAFAIEDLLEEKEETRETVAAAYKLEEIPMLITENNQPDHQVITVLSMVDSSIIQMAPSSSSIIRRHVAVIGAGAAGLVAARELRREGHSVVVFERQNQVGGTWIYTDYVEQDPLS
ncbi:hypothetical protein YC2023_106105 [Brassica napus]